MRPGRPSGAALASGSGPALPPDLGSGALRAPSHGAATEGPEENEIPYGAALVPACETQRRVHGGGYVTEAATPSTAERASKTGSSRCPFRLSFLIGPSHEYSQEGESRNRAGKPRFLPEGDRLFTVSMS